MSCAETSKSIAPTLAERIEYVQMRREGCTPSQFLTRQIEVNRAMFTEGIEQIAGDLLTKQREKESELNAVAAQLEQMTLFEPEIKDLTEVAKRQQEDAKRMQDTFQTIGAQLEKEKEDKKALVDGLGKLQKVAKKAYTFQNPFKQ